MEDGLPSNHIYRICQDKKGLIWIATPNGVSAFDGIDFKNFTVEDGLCDKDILQTFADSQGRVWFSGFNGLLCFFKDGKFYNNKNTPWLPRSLSGRYFKHIVETKDKEILFTDGLSLFKLNPSDEIEEIKKEHPIAWCYFGRNEEIIYPDKTEISFMGEAGAWGLKEDGWYQYNFRTSQTNFMFPTYDEGKNTWAHIFYDEKIEGYWISSAQGLVLWIANKRGIKYSKILDFHALLDFRDRAGNYWIATNKGVYFLKAELLKTNFHELPPLSDGNTIRSITADDAGNIWLGFSDGLLAKSKNNSFIFFEDKYAPNSNCHLKDITRASNGWLLISNDCGLVVIKKPKQTNGKDLNILRKFNKTGLGYFENNQFYLLNHTSSKSAIVLNNGQIYLGDFRGIVKPENTSNKITYEKIFNERVHLLRAGKKTIWANSNQGLIKCEQDSCFAQNFDEPKLKERLIDIEVIDDDFVWVATISSGIFCVYKNKIYNISRKDGLASQSCNSISVQGDSVIWMGSPPGLHRIKYTIKDEILKIDKIELYGKNHGLQSKNIDKVYASKNSVWVTSGKGLLNFTEKNLGKDQNPPCPYISNISIQNKDTIIHENYNLPHNKNSISIAYRDACFKSTQYEYQLKGLDNNWIPTTQSQVNFSYLSPGSYSFFLRAQNGEVVWSEKKQMTAFYIRPALWQRWWFWPAIALLIGLGIAWLVYLRFKRREQRTTLLREIEDYKHKALSAQINPHFMFNALNSIQSYILKNDKKNANKYLSNFAKLMRLTLDNSLETQISLAQELEALELYMSLEAIRFSKKFEYEIQVAPEIDTTKTKIPSLLIQPFVENAIWHGIMHKAESNGKIWIRIKREGEMLQCEVEDNGIGRKKAAEIKKSSHRLKHKSAGMSITEKRLQLLNSLKKFKYNYQITDLYKDGQPSGTKINFSIPHILNSNQTTP